jgi:uncharacterized protein DUF3999
MKRFHLAILIVTVGLTLAIRVFAQTPITSWPYFVELQFASGAPGVYDLIVPFDVLDKSREDLADLRIYDGNGSEIPYAIRVRTEAAGMRTIEGRLFNQATVGSSSEVTIDLGPNADEHNAIEIDTEGENFRRRVSVEGSDTGTEWRTLKSGDVIFKLKAENGTVYSNRVTYPTSRYRYLRVRVSADEVTDERAPVISDVKMIMGVREPGDRVTWSVSVPSFQLLRHQGAPASSWAIELGARVPCDRIAFDFSDQSFSRPAQLETIDGDNVRLVASGELTKHAGQTKPIVINFYQEEHTRKLRLLVTDHSNPPLSITSIQASAPARQLVFELKRPAVRPVRLFFGNPKIAAPHYDFENELATKLAAPPTRINTGSSITNTDYKPDPLPFTERAPWLIYLILGLSSVALALILISLARKTLRRGQINSQQK